MNTNTEDTNEPSENRQSKVICSTDLLDALEEMVRIDNKDHPDETVSWAINELSDDGWDYLFASKRKVINAYKALRESNERDKQ